MKTKIILSILLISLLIFSISLNMIIPSSDNAKENSNAPENSNSINESNGLWIVTIPTKPCKKDYCI